jgi:hypothetical protein
MLFAPGTTMNLTLPQWIACFVLDLLIKSLLVTAFGILVTLRAAPVSVFLYLAISLSMLHFICVFLGVTVALLFELLHLRLSSVLNWIVTVVVANVAFLSLCLMLIRPNPDGVETDTHAAADWVIGAVLVGVNLAPFLIVSMVSCAIRRLSRFFGRIVSTETRRT